MKKKILILDLDGTLYYQVGMQLFMGSWILIYYIFHFWKIKELIAILNYRKNREQELKDIVDIQFSLIAEKYHMSLEKIEYLINNWLIKKPLKIIYLFRDKKLIEIINEFKKKNGKIIIYSDYPTKEKLKALKIKYDLSYDSLYDKIRVLKPDPKGLNVIIKENNLNRNEILFVGDRDKKDGAISRKNKVDYVILPKLNRKKIYKEIKQKLGGM